MPSSLPPPRSSPFPYTTLFRVGARHQAGLRGAQPPARHEVLDHDGRNRHMRQQAADLAEAHGEHECAAVQMLHGRTASTVRPGAARFADISMVIEIVLDLSPLFL